MDKEAFYSYIKRHRFRNMSICSKEFLDIRYEEKKAKENDRVIKNMTIS